MRLNIALVTAALSATVASNFVIVTVPVPGVDLFNNIQSQASSLKAAVTSKLGALTASLPASELRAAVSAQTALAAFVASAPSSYSIPSKVTDIGAFETFSTTPAWYSALPSELRSYYDGNNQKAQSAINEALGKTTSASAAASGTGAAGVKSTGVASGEKVVGYMGVGVAAAVAGVFAL